MIEGKGLHSGRDVRIVVHPAPADHGIVFERSDIKGDSAFVKAKFENVSKTYLRTELTNSSGFQL